jgi:hypothetical protein
MGGPRRHNHLLGFCHVAKWYCLCPRQLGREGRIRRYIHSRVIPVMKPLPRSHSLLYNVQNDNRESSPSPRARDLLLCLATYD